MDKQAHFSAPNGAAEQLQQPDVQPETGVRLSLWKLIRSDLARYRVTDKQSYFSMFIICPGVLPGILYRVGHWLWTYQGRFRLLATALQPFYILLKRVNEMLNGITIQPQAKIGKGLYVGHGGSVYIGGGVVMGDNCNLSHEVTIGVAGRQGKRGMPVIGNRVYIAPGAKIFGPITIGDDVAIGANAVVTKSVPDHATAVGIPATVVSFKGSFDFVLYENMEADSNRIESLRLLKSRQTP